MARYIPDENHPFLSDDAKALASSAPEGFSVHADIAERLLGLSDLDVSSDATKTASATAAVARQISLQIEVSPDMALMESVTRGDRSETYRDLSSMFAIDPLAREIASSLLVEASKPKQDQSRYRSMHSTRGRNIGSGYMFPTGEESIQP